MFEFLCCTSNNGISHRTVEKSNSCDLNSQDKRMLDSSTLNTCTELPAHNGKCASNLDKVTKIHEGNKVEIQLGTRNSFVDQTSRPFRCLPFSSTARNPSQLSTQPRAPAFRLFPTSGATFIPEITTAEASCPPP